MTSEQHPHLDISAACAHHCIECFTFAQSDSDSYVQLLASYDVDGPPTNWFVASTSSLFDGLTVGNNSLSMCADAPTRKPTSSPALSPTTTLQPSIVPTQIPLPSSASTFGEASGDNADYRRLATPANSPTYMSEHSECCMGQPAAMYLVACVVNQFPTADIFDGVFAKKHKKNVHKFEKHKFNEYCVAAAGVCGSPCGFSTRMPDSKYCQEMDPINNPGVFTIPEHYLFGAICDDDDSCNDDNYIDSDDTGVASGVIYSPQFHSLSLTANIFHVLFMAFMTITVRNWWF